MTHDQTAPLSSHLPVLLLCLVPLSLGCESKVDWLVIEAEVEEFCVVGMRSDFEASPTGLISQDIGGDDFGVTLNERFTASMYLRGLGFAPESGVDNVDFIDTLRLDAITTEDESVALLSYEAGRGQDLSFVESKSAFNIANILKSDELGLVVEFAGALPTTAWTAKMEVCFGIEAAFREPL